MRLVLVLCFATFVGFYCSNRQEKSSVVVSSEVLTSIIEGYVKLIDQIRKNNGIATIFFKMRGDTVKIDITNSPPDLSKTKMNGLLVMENCKICFVGDYPGERFYNIIGKVEVPSNVVSANKSARNASEGKSITEPKLWSFYFILNTLSDYRTGLEDNNSILRVI